MGRDTTSGLEVQGLEAQEVVREIQAAIVHAGLDQPRGQGGLTLETVTIAMATVAEFVVGAKPTFKVPFVGWEIGGSVERKNVETHTINVELRTPWAPVSRAEAAPLAGVADVRVALPAVISSMRDMLEQGQVGPARLDLGTAKLVFKFDVTREGHLELAVPYAGKRWQGTITVSFGFGAPR